MLSSTLINEARFGFGREHTYRLQPNGDDTSNLPGAYGILGIPQLAGNGGLPLIRIGNQNLSDLRSRQLGGERAVQQHRAVQRQPDEGVQVARLQGRLHVPEHLLRFDAAAVRARRVQLRRPLHVDREPSGPQHRARAQLLLNQIPSLVPGGVDFLGGLNELRASPFGAVDAFKTYHGAYVQDSWHASSKLTVNYGLRWD